MDSQSFKDPHNGQYKQPRAQFKTLVPPIELKDANGLPPQAKNPRTPTLKRKKGLDPINTSFREPLPSVVQAQTKEYQKEAEKSVMVTEDKSSGCYTHDGYLLTPKPIQRASAATEDESSGRYTHDGYLLTPRPLQRVSAVPGIKKVPSASEKHVSPPPLTAIWDPVPTFSPRKHPKAFTDAEALRNILPTDKIEAAQKFRRGYHPADRVAATVVAAKKHIEAQAIDLAAAESEQGLLERKAQLTEVQIRDWHKAYLKSEEERKRLKERVGYLEHQGAIMKAQLELQRTQRKFQLAGSLQGTQGGIADWVKNKSKEADDLLDTSRGLGVTAPRVEATASRQANKVKPTVWKQGNLLESLRRVEKDRKIDAEQELEAKTSKKAEFGIKSSDFNVDYETEESELTEEDDDIFDTDYVEPKGRRGRMRKPKASVGTPCPPPQPTKANQTGMPDDVLRALQAGTRVARADRNQ